MGTILQVTDKGPGGGGLRRIVDLYDEIGKAAGHEMRLARLSYDPSPSEGDEPVFAAGRSPDPEFEAMCRSADLVHLHLGFTALTAAHVDCAARSGPVLVSLHDVTPFLSLRLRRDRKDLNTPHVFGLTALRHLRHARKRAALWRALAGRADQVLAPSTYLQRLARKAGAPEAKVVLLAHGVAVPRDPPASGGKPISAGQADPDIVYAGLLQGRKGAPLLLEAFARVTHPKARLLIYGNGPSETAMRERADRPDLKGRVIFFGHTPHETVIKAMRAARAVAHPSLIQEGLGLSGLEALANGRPVAGFGLGGTADWLIDEETGLLATPGDPASLAEAMTRLLADPALADRLGAGGVQHVRTSFDPDNIARELCSIYARHLKARQ